MHDGIWDTTALRQSESALQQFPHPSCGKKCGRRSEMDERHAEPYPLDDWKCHIPFRIQLWFGAIHCFVQHSIPNSTTPLWPSHNTKVILQSTSNILEQITNLPKNRTSSITKGDTSASQPSPTKRQRQEEEEREHDDRSSSTLEESRNEDLSSPEEDGKDVSLKIRLRTRKESVKKEGEKWQVSRKIVVFYQKDMITQNRNAWYSINITLHFPSKSRPQARVV